MDMGHEELLDWSNGDEDQPVHSTIPSTQSDMDDDAVSLGDEETHVFSHYDYEPPSPSENYLRGSATPQRTGHQDEARPSASPTLSRTRHALPAKPVSAAEALRALDSKQGRPLRNARSVNTSGGSGTERPDTDTNDMSPSWNAKHSHGTSHDAIDQSSRPSNPNRAFADDRVSPSRERSRSLNSWNSGGQEASVEPAGRATRSAHDDHRAENFFTLQDRSSYRENERSSERRYRTEIKLSDVSAEQDSRTRHSVKETTAGRLVEDEVAYPVRNSGYDRYEPSRDHGSGRVARNRWEAPTPANSYRPSGHMPYKDDDEGDKAGVEGYRNDQGRGYAPPERGRRPVSYSSARSTDATFTEADYRNPGRPSTLRRRTPSPDDPRARRVYPPSASKDFSSGYASSQSQPHDRRLMSSAMHHAPSRESYDGPSRATQQLRYNTRQPSSYPEYPPDSLLKRRRIEGHDDVYRARSDTERYISRSDMQISGSYMLSEQQLHRSTRRPRSPPQDQRFQHVSSNEPSKYNPMRNVSKPYNPVLERERTENRAELSGPPMHVTSRRRFEDDVREPLSFPIRRQGSHYSPPHSPANEKEEFLESRRESRGSTSYLHPDENERGRAAIIQPRHSPPTQYTRMRERTPERSSHDSAQRAFNNVPIEHGTRGIKRQFDEDHREAFSGSTDAPVNQKRQLSQAERRFNGEPVPYDEVSSSVSKQTQTEQLTTPVTMSHPPPLPPHMQHQMPPPNVPRRDLNVHPSSSSREYQESSWKNSSHSGTEGPSRPPEPSQRSFEAHQPTQRTEKLEWQRPDEPLSRPSQRQRPSRFGPRKDEMTNPRSSPPPPPPPPPPSIVKSPVVPRNTMQTWVGAPGNDWRAPPPIPISVSPPVDHSAGWSKGERSPLSRDKKYHGLANRPSFDRHGQRQYSPPLPADRPRSQQWHNAPDNDRRASATEAHAGIDNAVHTARLVGRSLADRINSRPSLKERMESDGLPVEDVYADDEYGGRIGDGDSLRRGRNGYRGRNGRGRMRGGPSNSSGWEHRYDS